jgi:2-polyprenyl-3-methyl-5-hydroxy-6-metoxy-1,4-benzoquinol methylase
MYTVLDLGHSPNGKGSTFEEKYIDIDIDIRNLWDKIYRDNYLNWQGEKSKSGRGSEGKDADSKLNIIDMIISRLKVKNIMDIGCGDFYWASKLKKLNMLNKYFAIDVSNYIIEENKMKYKFDNVEFLNIDMSNKKENNLFLNQDIDLVILLDVLGHCIQNEIDNIINFLMNSKVKYLVINNIRKDWTLWDGEKKNIRNLPVHIEKHKLFNFKDVYKIDSFDFYSLR